MGTVVMVVEAGAASAEKSAERTCASFWESVCGGDDNDANDVCCCWDGMGGSISIVVGKGAAGWVNGM